MIIALYFTHVRIITFDFSCRLPFFYNFNLDNYKSQPQPLGWARYDTTKRSATKFYFQSLGLLIFFFLSHQNFRG